MAASRLSYALRCFTASREAAERRLKWMRAELSRMRKWRKNFLGKLLFFLWNRRAYNSIQDTRWRVRFYRQVEQDLRAGNLKNAINALAIFAPPPETSKQMRRRVVRDRFLDGVTAVFRSPDILREEMLRLRNDLIAIQSGKG